MRFLIHFVTLAAFWWLLSGQTRLFLLICGLVVCLGTAVISSRMALLDEESQPLGMVPRLLAFVPWLFWQVLVSNWDVVKRVWTPGLDIQPCIVKAPMSLKNGFAQATYANSITLTPGTVTIDTEAADGYLVHALHQPAADGLLTGDMHARVKRVEGGA